ncbi:dolichyl-phosphate-mannose--protein mannosyltransferase [Ruania alba]|uniref:Polyprenol-phosphate-mannose--protein mannosyltransferase n=1 Tax=Ruania alba TaxID=648782 RepID=A0A1H5N014_9MICO|nr:phospholipid carrier-dependent glycosyltransferase [Ruania alba]SEE94915.1 Dolichyl-phosphate-mannose-protein mannosyltransferase [Ruania alba]
MSPERAPDAAPDAPPQDVSGSTGANEPETATRPRWWHPREVDVAGRSAAEIEQSLIDRMLSPVAGSRLWGWVGALLVTAIAGVLRLVHLERPGRLVFDETYYVKQAYSLLTLGYEGDWNEEPNENFAAGDFSDLQDSADYVVHPGVGKWMIAVGMRLLGPETPWGWRISAAVIGTLSVLLLARIARRLFSSSLLGCTAALLLAVDGVHITMSRISILDIFLQFWVLAAFGAVLLDREQYRRRLARLAATELATHGRYRDPWGPRVGMRWWLLVAAVCLGLACGVKWSGIYAVAVLGIAVVAWSVTARRSAGVPLWVGGGTLRDGLPAFVTLVPTAAAVYMLTWLPWWLSPHSYNRQWAAEVNATAEVPARTWMPDWLNSWWEYHLKMWDFHNGLTSEHTYMSHPAGWLIQLRPTSFAWRDVEDSTSLDLCGAERCVGAITSVGNPVLWWGAALALLLVLWAALRRGDWRAWAILIGYAATYLPWFAYAHRTIFTFYTVALAPFVAMCLTFAIGTLLGSRHLTLQERRPGIWTAAALVILAVLVGAFYWPVWSNQWVPYWFWRLHMLLPSWV